MPQRAEPTVESHRGIWPRIDQAAFIHSSAVLIGEVILGRDVSVWPHATLRADEGEIVIGAGSNIQDGCTVHMTGGRSTTHVGERVTVGHNAVLHGCTIGDDCLIGMGAIILDNAEISAGSLVGAGALVTGDKSFPPDSMLLGNPARLVRKLTDDERAWIEHAWKHYVEQANRYAGRGDRDEPSYSQA